MSSDVPSLGEEKEKEEDKQQQELQPEAPPAGKPSSTAADSILMPPPSFLVHGKGEQCQHYTHTTVLG